MPHDGQVLPLAARRGTTALILSAIALGCAPSGDVVVVIDSTMRGEAVEVVAVPTSSPGAAIERPGAPPGASDSVTALRLLDDSAASLDSAFRSLRDALGAEVRALDTADRTTRAYADRYADIRRRTAAAEALRATRDSIRKKGVALRARLGDRAAPPSGSGAGASRAKPADDGREVTRAPIRAGVRTLSLPPGHWSIGIAPRGDDPAHYNSITVRRGATDTVRFGPP
jgi:hypothetical protein